VARRLAVAIVGAALASLFAVSLLDVDQGAADSFTPVRLAISVAPVARLNEPLPITVRVSADANVLDTATTPLRVRVRLAKVECGGTFSTTPGNVLLDKQLSPQPTTGHAYQAAAKGFGRPTAYGARIVCAFLEEQGDNRMFANDTIDPPRVTVSKPCTSQAARYDVAVRALARAQQQLRHAHGSPARARLARLVARRRRAAGTDRRKARAACGPGVTL
jgi:hypothetical protein